MKRERDILEARQSVAEGEASRLESTLSVTQRALDEARGELKKELDSRVSVRGAEEFNRLTAEVTQVRLTNTPSRFDHLFILTIAMHSHHHQSLQVLVYLQCLPSVPSL